MLRWPAGWPVRTPRPDCSRSHLASRCPWRPLLAKLGYPVAFLIVVLGRQQLFTENTLTVILPLLTRRNAGTSLVAALNHAQVVSGKGQPAARS